MGYLYVFLTIVLTVYGQVVIKWRVNLAGSIPEGVNQQLAFFASLLLNPWVITGLTAYAMAAIAWMAAMTKFHR